MSANQGPSGNIARSTEAEQAQFRLVVRVAKGVATEDDIRELQSLTRSKQARVFEAFVSANQAQLRLTADEERRLFRTTRENIGSAGEKNPSHQTAAGDHQAAGPSTIPQGEIRPARSARKRDGNSSEIVPYEPKSRAAGPEEIRAPRIVANTARRGGRPASERDVGVRGRRRVGRERNPSAQPQAPQFPIKEPERRLLEDPNALVCECPPVACSCFGGPSGRECKFVCECFGLSFRHGTDETSSGNSTPRPRRQTERVALAEEV